MGTITHKDAADMAIADQVSAAEWKASTTHLDSQGNDLELSRSATLVVAANNASAKSIAGADYVCDGTADDVQIQAAIDALPAGGGKVVLSEGTFSCTTALSIQKSDVLIEGMGKATKVDLASIAIDGFVFGDGATAITRSGISYLRVTSSVVKNAGTAIRFRKVTIGYATNFYLDKQFVGVGVESDCIIIRISNFEIIDSVATTGVGIRIISGTAAKNVDTYISNGNISAPLGSEPLIGIRVQNAGGVYLSDLDITFQQYGILVDPSGTNDYVEALFASQVLVDTCTINGFSVNPSAGKTAREFYLTNCWASTNLVGVYIGESQTGTIDSVWLRGLTAVNNQNQGVVFNYGTNLFVSDSDISGNSKAAANTSDGFVVASDISEWGIQSSRLGNHVVGAGTQRYGIFVISGASNNYSIQSNDLRGNGTGALSDGGTGTTKIVRNNLGYVTENSGTATVANGQTTVTVTHGLATTPTRVQVTPTLLSNAASFWVTAKGTTTFVINVNADPGAGTATFDWRAQVGEG
uniref:Uncharacterized protein n=2 Tax=viral metagenome TaxID=1070528 RepID=A0A6M3J6Y7_9ZZZZ